MLCLVGGSLIVTSIVVAGVMLGFSLQDSSDDTRKHIPGFPTYGLSSRELLYETSKDSLRFVSLSDWGIEEDKPHAVGIAKALLDRKDEFDLIFAGGDNFYDDGVIGLEDFRWLTTWFYRFKVPELNLPWLAVLGNHDYRGNIDSQMQYGKSLEYGAPYWFMPNNYYSLSVKQNVSDTTPLKMLFVDTEDVEPIQLTWIRDQLAADENTTKLGLGHTHIYSSGTRGDNPWYPAKYLNDAFVDGGVKAYICGHEHDMQYLQRHGIDYFLTGGGGGGLRPKNIFGSKAKEVFWSKTFGYAEHEFEFNTRKMTTIFHFIDSDGQLGGQETFISQY